jgi:hypothetical protein
MGVIDPARRAAHLLVVDFQKVEPTLIYELCAWFGASAA